MNFVRRIWRLLAQAFPHEFKLVYGDEMTQLGDDMIYQLAKRHGTLGLIRLIADIAIRLPIEYLAEVRQDLRYASRALVKSPGFAFVGIISMGLAIGLTTNIYSSNWALLTRELPAAANAGHLAMTERPVSYFYVEQYREQKALFTGVAAIVNNVPFNTKLPGRFDIKPDRIVGQLVSSDYFSVLGVEPQRGRLLSPELDKSGTMPSVVITDRFWRDRMSASPTAVGQTLRINGHLAVIVGITPKDFDGAAAVIPAELFVPITAPASLAPELANDILHRRNARALQAILCLAPGVTIDNAEAALDTITRRLDVDDPSAPPPRDTAKRVVLLQAGTRVPLPRRLKPVIEGFFLVLMGLTMAIACMNLAAMLLARGANRRKELAIRLGVGASRFRLVRQMISEGILLSLIGGIVGFSLVYGLSALNSQIQPPAGAPVQVQLPVDWRAGVFAFAVAIVCGVGFSVAPALQATRVEIAPAIRQGSAMPLLGYRRFGLRNLAVAAQVAGSLTLLLITGFLVMGIIGSNKVQARFDTNKMYLLSLDPVRDGYAPAKAQALFQKARERLATIGGVDSVTLAFQAPFTPDDDDADVDLTVQESRVQKPAVLEKVGAGYFSALNDPILAGREFSDADQRLEPNSPVLPLILNQSAARAFFGNSNAIGKRLRDDKRSYEVAGVVTDLKSGGLLSSSVAYAPLTVSELARPAAGGITLMVRSSANADALSAVRREIDSIDPNLTILNMETLSAHLARSRFAMQSAIRRFGGIGLFGLLLSAIGLAGVTAYAVAQRRREIGIRMALGARKAQVLRLVLREGFALVVVGTVLGFAGAVVFARILSAATSDFADAVNIGTNDPRLLIGAPLLLAMVAMFACYLPARRAAKIDPLKALREE